MWAKLPEDLNEGISVEVLADGLYRNHGYWHDQDNGEDVGYFGSDQGTLRLHRRLN